MSTLVSNTQPSSMHISGPALLETLPDICVFVDRGDNLRTPNAVAARKLGLRSGSDVGVSLEAIVSHQGRDKFITAARHCRTAGSIEEGTAEFLSADRTIFQGSYRFAPITVDDEALCFLTIHDNRDENARELDLLRFANVAHYTVNPLEITDTNGNIVYVNPAFEKASGWTSAELIGKNPSVFGSGKHPKAFWEHMWKTIASGEVWTGEVENRRRTGEAFFTQVLISPILDAAGKLVGYFGVHRDIAQQKHLEQQLMNAQKMESIGLLAAGLAHEVGNPLTSISSLVQIIRRSTQDEFITDKLDLIKSQVTRISKIIRELVDFSRQTINESVDTDVNAVLSEAVEIVRVGMKAKDIRFETAYGAELPHLPLVPDKIQQVFINILINAVDAMENKRNGQGGISVKSFKNEEFVSVSITDTGSGIPDDAIPKIFDPFFTTKPLGRGTGLGLWVSYTIVKRFNGDISVESAVDKGTTFLIRFPIEP